MLVDFDVRGTSADGLFHWKKHFYALRTHILAKSDGLKLKCINYGFVSKTASFLIHKMVLIVYLLWCFY